MILALDPGQRTGYALVDVDGHLIEAGSFGWEDWGKLLELVSNELECAVVERFALYGNKAGAMVGNEFEASQVIGALRFALYERGTTPIHFQPASAIHSGARTLSPFAKRLMEAVPLKRGQVDRHAKDALAHALVYMRRSRA